MGYITLYESACLLIANCFTHREQRVSMGVARREWSQVIKETPQGSILCAYVFNIFQNDLMYLLNSLCDIFRYLTMQTAIPWGVCHLAFKNWR